MFMSVCKNCNKEFLTRNKNAKFCCNECRFCSLCSKESLVGKRFGRLTVIQEIKEGRKIVFCLCLCDCGKIKKVRVASIKSGQTKSCGCLVVEKAKEIQSRCFYKHGLTKTRIHKIWTQIKQRCFNKKAPFYKNYGGRGICMYAEWKNNFLLFYDWALKNGYQDNLTIDRIDVNGNYEPSNCRWITMLEQTKNTRKSVFIIYKGERKIASDWAKTIGVDRNILYRRKRMGWSDKDIIETPVKKRI